MPSYAMKEQFSSNDSFKDKFQLRDADVDLQAI